MRKTILRDQHRWVQDGSRFYFGVAEKEATYAAAHRGNRPPGCWPNRWRLLRLYGVEQWEMAGPLSLIWEVDFLTLLLEWRTVAEDLLDGAFLRWS